MGSKKTKLEMIDSGCVCQCDCGARSEAKKKLAKKLGAPIDAFSLNLNGELKDTVIRGKLAEAYLHGVEARHYDRALQRPNLTKAQVGSWKGLINFWENYLRNRRFTESWLADMVWEYYSLGRWPEKVDMDYFDGLPTIEQLGPMAVYRTN